LAGGVGWQARTFYQLSLDIKINTRHWVLAGGQRVSLFSVCFMLLAIGHMAPGDMHCVLIIPAIRAIEAAFPVPQKTLPKWQFPLLFD
jgi:hypothetical protein